jgi:flagellar motor switch protein FliM
MFARTLSAMLTAHMSTGIQVDPLSVDQVSYRQFCHSVPETTAIGVFALPPLDGLALFEIDPLVAWSFLERGLGSQNEESGARTEFTALDKGLLDDLFRRILRELAKAWDTLAPLKPALREVVANAGLARIASPDDRVIVCSFGLTMQETTGMAHYCIAENSLDFERLLGADDAWDTEGEVLSAEQDRELVHELLLDAPLAVRACLPPMSVGLGELAALREGDIVHFDARADEPVPLCIVLEPLLLGRPMTVEDRVVVEVVGMSDAVERREDRGDQ